MLGRTGTGRRAGREAGKKQEQVGADLGLESSSGGTWRPRMVPSARASGMGDVITFVLLENCSVQTEQSRQEEKEEARLLQKASFASQTPKFDEDMTFHYLMYVINTASNLFL